MSNEPYQDNTGGLVLDIDWDRMINVHLPSVKTTVTKEYDNEIIEHVLKQYGTLILMGDFHIGHDAHTVNPFNAYLKYIYDHPYIKVGIMGDMIEFSSKTKYIKDEIMDVDDQIDIVVKKLKPIADRIEFMLWGNHDERFSQYTDSKKLLYWIAKEIGVKEDCYIGKPQRGVFVAIHSGDQVYGMYAHHSRTGAVINKTIQLRRSGAQNIVPIIAHGHTHHLGREERTFKTMEIINGTPQMVTKRQWLISTGCFMKDASYAEARSYPYTVVGAPILRFHADRNEMEYSDLTQEYRGYLDKGGIVFGAETGISDRDEFIDKFTNPYEVRQKCLL